MKPGMKEAAAKACDKAINKILAVFTP